MWTFRQHAAPGHKIIIMVRSITMLQNIHYSLIFFTFKSTAHSYHSQGEPCCSCWHHWEAVQLGSWRTDIESWTVSPTPNYSIASSSCIWDSEIGEWMHSSEVYPESLVCLIICSVIALLVARDMAWVCGLRPLVQPPGHQQLPCIRLRRLGNESRISRSKSRFQKPTYFSSVRIIMFLYFSVQHWTFQFSV